MTVAEKQIREFEEKTGIPFEEALKNAKEWGESPEGKATIKKALEEGRKASQQREAERLEAEQRMMNDHTIYR